MNSARSSKARAVAIVVLFGCAQTSGCKRQNDEEDVPLAPPSVLSAPAFGSDNTPSPSAPLTTAPAPSSVDAGPKRSAVNNACCAALRHSVGGATPELQGAYLLAAEACDVMTTSGRLDAARLHSMLMGEALPASCR